MKLDFMMLANYAEVQNGLLYISGGTWDTTNVHAPPQGPGVPEGTVAVVQGTLVARVLFHVTETGRDHGFTVSIMDEDGGDVLKIEGGGPVGLQPELPPGWDQGLNLAVPLTGLTLKKFGRYNISLQIDDQHVADLPFRVVQRY